MAAPLRPASAEAAAQLQEYVEAAVIRAVPPEKRPAFRVHLRRVLALPPASDSAWAALQEALREARPVRARTGRSRRRAGDLPAEWLRRLPPSPVYLDLGGGDGSITEAVASELVRLRRAPRRTILVDTQARPPELPPAFEHVQVKPGESLASRVGGQSIDFATAFMVFHHLGPGLDAAIEGLATCLRAGGLLAVREHDFEASEFVDWVHVLYDLAERDIDLTSGSEPPDFEPAVYLSAADLQARLAKAGFVQEHLEKKPGPMQAYVALYRLKTPQRPRRRRGR